MSKRKKHKNQDEYNKLLALKGEEMPDSVEVAGISWQKQKTFKHDFFAATGLYENSDKKLAVLKIFRPHSYMGLPYGLLSRWEASHEEKVYKRLQSTGNVPGWLGRFGKTGIMHEFIPGHDLTRDTPVDDNFFDELEKLLQSMHDLGIAYVDTNKMDNVLVGDDGKCYLIDFQITWVQPFFPLNLLTWPLFYIFKVSDFYHAIKHRRKVLPESVSQEEYEARIPWFIKIHRMVANPIRKFRRSYLRKVEKKATHHPEGTARH